MIEKQNLKPVDPKDYDYLSSAAAHDCTGLIPMKLPNDDSALNSYGDIYPYLPVIPVEENPGDQGTEMLRMIHQD